ncbi:MAG: 6-pyruvoyl tetrahydropterin synthase family protein [Gemmatimonadales bacterium]
MAQYLLSAEATFSAAHTLPNVPVCDRFHGHNWRVRLTVRLDARGLDDRGLGVDLRDIEQAARECVQDFDHSYLNDLEPFRDQAPSAERIALVVAERATARLGRLNPAVCLEEVEVWETPQFRVAYRPERCE